MHSTAQHSKFSLCLILALSFALCSCTGTSSSPAPEPLSITVTEIKNTGDIRPYYAVFKIKASSILSDYTLALKEKSATAPTAAEMDSGLVYKRSINPTEMNIYAWGAIGTTVSSNNFSGTAARTMLLKPGTTYTLYGMESGKTEVAALKDFTTDAEPTTTTSFVYDNSIAATTQANALTFTMRNDEKFIWVVPYVDRGGTISLFRYNSGSSLTSCDGTGFCSTTSNDNNHFYASESRQSVFSNIFWLNEKINNETGLRFQYSGNDRYFGITIENPGAISAPTLATQPTNATVAFGAAASFSVVSNAGGVLSYQWQKAESSSPSTFTDVAGGSTLTISSARDADNGDIYRVTVSNIAGSVTSNAVTLTVNIPNPSISVQPVDVTLNALATATFSVTANVGGANLTYQWQKAESSANTIFTNIAGATLASYSLSTSHRNGDDGDKFRVVVTNSVGVSVTSNVATLTVNASPEITQQPVSVTVAIGAGTFSVSAVGAAPLSYQWQERVSAGAWSNVSGATNTSYTTPAGVGSGQYRVIVSNSFGSVESDVVKLNR